MKNRNGELVVATREDGQPRLISFGGHTYCVLRILRNWEEKTHWWSRKPRRACFHVATQSNVLEIYREGNRWILGGILPESALNQ